MSGFRGNREDDSRTSWKDDRRLCIERPFATRAVVVGSVADGGPDHEWPDPRPDRGWKLLGLAAVAPAAARPQCLRSWRYVTDDGGCCCCEGKGGDERCEDCPGEHEGKLATKMANKPVCRETTPRAHSSVVRTSVQESLALGTGATSEDIVGCTRTGAGRKRAWRRSSSCATALALSGTRRGRSRSSTTGPRTRPSWTGS